MLTDRNRFLLVGRGANVRRMVLRTAATMAGTLLGLIAWHTIGSSRLSAAPPDAQIGPVPGDEDRSAKANDHPPKAADPAAAANAKAAPSDKPAAGKASDAPPDKPAAGAPAAAPPAEKSVGRLIRVPVPIEGNVDTRVQTAVGRVLSNLPAGSGRPVLIFEFSPGQTEAGRGSEFGRALALARYISSARELSGVKTVAYVPRTIKGHAVLAVMACEEIIMAPDAEIGEAGIDEPTIGPTIRSGYKEIAEARKTIPPALALGMLDKDLKVLKVTTEIGTEFILADELPELKKHRTIQKVEELTPTPGLYSGRKARQDLGFVSYLADDPPAVAKALDLPASAMRDDPSLYGGWKPVQVPVKGPITQALAEQTLNKIREQVENHDANFVCLWIDSAGGSADDRFKLIDLANYLASLDSSKVRTVAYIPSKARGDAALLAAACDQIVMGPTAMIGGSGDYELPGDACSDLSRNIRSFIATQKKTPWSLPAALVDPEIKLYNYVQQTTGQKGCFSEDEVKQFRDAAQWQQGQQIWGGGAPLLLTGERADELGLATSLAGNFAEFKQRYGLENDPALVEPGWVDFLIGALSSPAVLSVLLFLGVAGVIAELQAPGIGIGAFVAIVAFLLYFWVEHLHGTAGWLEVLLFAGGLACLLLEIFVLPGFAIFGLGGGAMIILSLVMASQTFIIPRNDYQWGQLQNTILTFGAALAGAIVAGLVIRRFLPRAPGFGRIFLKPFSGEEAQQIATRETIADFRHLVGQSGTTTTPLMPSGKARFGDELVDVMSDGEVIDRDVAVVAVEARGNRVVVRAAPQA